MEKVVSLVDLDVVVIKASGPLTDKQLGKYEKELGQKLNKQVVILPFGLDLYTYMQEEPAEDIWSELKDIVKIKKEEKQKEYRLLNKEEYERLMEYRSRKSTEERWDRLSNGNKYIVYTESGDMGIQLYSLDNFFNKTIL